MNKRNILPRAIPLAAAGLTLAAILSGCGGASNSTGILPTPASGPVVNGLSANDIIGSGTVFEISSLASADAKTAYLTGPTASTAKPLTTVSSQFNGTIPLGFAPDASVGVSGSNIGTAVATGASVIFGANISNGNNSAVAIGINPNSVVLTSPEVAGFSQKLSFTASKAQTGPLVNAQYTTGAFTLPFATPGLHKLRVAVADQSGQSSTTDFDVVVVNATTVALYAANITPDNADGTAGTKAQAINAGDTATITNPVTGARAQSTADANGVVILFTTPGVQTFTVTDAGKTVTQTIDLTKAAGTAVIQ